MTLLVPQKKIPMRFWWEWSDIVYDQMGIVARTLSEHGRAKEAAFFRFYRAELKELWLKTHQRTDNDNYRHNYATIYRRFLRELPVTARTLQDLLDDDWRGGFMDTPPEMRGGYAKTINDGKTGNDKDDEEDQSGKGGKQGGGCGAGGFRTMRGAQIFGYPDYDNPRGIADGWPRQGYLPYVMRNMILGQVGFLYLGALKPREGVTPGSTPALGYDAMVRQNLDTELMRRTFDQQPRPR